MNATAATTIITIPPSRDPLSAGFWGQHSATWSAELLARVQATDQRYDTDGSGDLSSEEVAVIFAPGGNQPKTLLRQLLAVYLNLGTRRVDALTNITSKAASRLGIENVREAALYAMETLETPPSPPNRDRYSNITSITDDINNNRHLRY